jgi:putative protease
MAEKKVAKAEKKPAGKKLIGKIGHYFTKIGVAVVDVEGTISVGDKISIEGPSTNFEQTIASMQVEHESVKSAKKGQSIGMKVKEPVREKDLVYKVA